ncbi:hypothetical protein AWC38_SpisGene23880 [Stylophora pistillata]|uniref:Uncharacterized protein n=1 Tax=Stylophora pistillata TaxID=50429 RepID=A0A2B4R6T5_STYPI|nr:hypothetical protein AWC38_SpisGene23880 [Stylophora pistillata]
MPSMRSGRRAHGLLNQVIRKIQGEKSGVDLEHEEKQLLQEFVENIEKHFGFKFRASELKIHGYTKQQQMDDDIHCWRGKIDAIGVMKNGTVIIVDWIVPRDENHSIWDRATNFSGKLHQTMIYREIIRAQWKDSYKCEKDIPTVGILIVPISTTGSDPRWCLDFKRLQEAGFFDDIDELTWTAQKPSKTDEAGEDHSRKDNTPDGASGRTPTDSYHTAKMYDTRNAAVGPVTQMPDSQHDIARTPVHRYYTLEEPLRLHSSYTQPGISAAQMFYRELAELEPYHFMVEYRLKIHKPQPIPDDYLPTLTPQDFAMMKLKRLS